MRADVTLSGAAQRLEGPLLFARREADVALNDAVEVIGDDGSARVGRVSAVDDDNMVIEVLESTTGLGLDATRIRILHRPLEMAVGPEVLIPRPETECLVEAALDFLKNEKGPEAPRFLDLGTGSGAIAMALARSCPTARVVALDRSCAALALADRNRRRHHLEDRVDLVAGDWLAPFSDTRARFDVVVSNPPYIPSGQIDGLQPEIVRYEPRAALDGGPDGLDCLALIIGAAPALLTPGGAVFLEIGHDQFAAVQRLATESGAYRDVACRPDYSGMDRVACLVRH